MKKAKPCPFCGTSNVAVTELYPGSDEFWVECRNEQCYGMGPSKSSEKEAISAWNQAFIYDNIEERDAAISEAVCNGTKVASSFVKGWRITLNET